MAETHFLTCYRKGCGKDYDPAENKEDSCKYHPGGPIFHDALKGWSCCKKRTCDFTEFLNIPGCTIGPHSNEKPVPPESKEPDQQNTALEKCLETIIIKGPEDNIKPRKTERPSEEEARISLKATVGGSLKTALEKALKEMDLNAEEGKEGYSSTEVKPGTSCKNKGCSQSYVDESSTIAPCTYHSGVPVFHEGLKYWSCCQRKTTEFDNFLAQEGCTTGRHCWFKKEDESKTVNCRIDWHQTAQFVTISVFAKVAVPEKTEIEANRVTVNMNITFDGGKCSFNKRIILRGVVDPERSNVKLLGTKVEINLRKGEPGTWSALEMPPNNPKQTELANRGLNDTDDLDGV